MLLHANPFSWPDRVLPCALVAAARFNCTVHGPYNCIPFPILWFHVPCIYTSNHVIEIDVYDLCNIMSKENGVLYEKSTEWILNFEIK